LLKQGYKPVARNVKLSHKELDIVVRQKGLVVFVEVKTRVSANLSEACNALSSKQIKYLKQAIKMYVTRHQLDPDRVRLDLICVDLGYSMDSAKISHFKDIF